MMYNFVNNMRQITPAKSNTIEKIVRDADGRLLRATFCVYENGGRIKARIISAVYLEEKLPSENETTYLTCQISKILRSSGTSFMKGGITSPYLDFNILYSSGSKPRAPTETK
jgi:hypothetical protein